MLKSIIVLYDSLNTFWSSRITSRVISTILIIIFFISLLATLVINSNIFKTGDTELNLFFAIDSSFTALLIFEILGLIFVLPRSVADSIGKQFEILSIILLRAAFKEFGHITHPMNEGLTDFITLLPMISDALGALIIFIIIGFYYRYQKHEKITKSEYDQQQFISFKKIIALLLLISFLVIGFTDIKSLFSIGKYDPSFNNFYTLLIFADILILLYSLRYQSHYTNLFRYSSYAFATLLIRLALSAPAFLNVFIGIFAGAFVLGLTFLYNFLMKKNVQHKNANHQT